MDEKLREFQVKYVTFYDGVGHRLGPSECTLTKSRLIISDIGGGIHQIALRDISGTSTPSRMGDPKTLRISLPAQAYDITFNSKDQKYAAEGWLSQAIRGSLAPESASVTTEAEAVGHGSGGNQVSSLPAAEPSKTGWAAIPLAGKIAIVIGVLAIIGIAAPFILAILVGILVIAAVIWGLFSMLG